MRLFGIACILGIVVIGTAISNEQRYDNYIAVLKNCLKVHELTEELYAYASEVNNTDGQYDKAKCADLCMFQALKIIKPDGHIDLEKALEHLLSGEPGVQRDIMRTNIESCSKRRTTFIFTLKYEMYVPIDEFEFRDSDLEFKFLPKKKRFDNK